MADIQYPLYHESNWSLATDVGARLDIGLPSASTTPTLTQVKAWLNMAQLDIANKAIDQAVNTLWATHSFDGDEFSLVETNIEDYWAVTMPTDFLRPIDVEYWRADQDGPTGALDETRMYKVFLLYRDMAQAWIRNNLYAPSVTNPIGYVWANKFYVTLADDVYENDKINLHYIKEPDLLDDDDYTELPHVFQEYMVQFAVMQAKIQDTKMEEVPTLSARYEQGIQMINMQAAQSYYGLMGRR